LFEEERKEERGGKSLVDKTWDKNGKWGEEKKKKEETTGLSPCLPSPYEKKGESRQQTAPEKV